jgi:hypothetical protein
MTPVTSPAETSPAETSLAACAKPRRGLAALSPRLARCVAALSLAALAFALAPGARACLAVVVPKSQSNASAASAAQQAQAAVSYCQTHNGAPPPGYFVVGDGPTVGPKQ